MNIPVLTPPRITMKRSSPRGFDVAHQQNNPCPENEIFSVIVIAALLLSLAGCGNTKSAFMTVEFCVRNSAGAADLVIDLKGIAGSNHMEFSDSSAATAKDLAEIGYRGRERSDGSPVINIGVLRKDGLFVGGGNLGLPGYQVQLGFTGGPDDAESNRFAEEVVARLRQRWRVRVLPPGSPARPMPDCR